MRGILTALSVIILVSFTALAQLSGPLSGIIGPGSYTIEGDISVEYGDSLTIAPGTVFLFEGEYQFDINGYLCAVGTAEDSIKFMPSASADPWRGIDFNDSTDDSSILEYCLITGAEASWIYPDNNAGGILCTGSSPTIRHCTITGNSVPGSWSNGAGICCYTYSSPIIENCNISRNSTAPGNGGSGGGIYCNDYCNPVIKNCLISQNFADMSGGGICIKWYSHPTIENCTIYGNSGYYGGGINCGAFSNPTISNCIIWGNIAPFGSQIDPSSPPIVSYCDVQYGFPGVGNIDSDPLFVSGLPGDFFLSQTAAGQAVQSPCVDAANPASVMILGTTRTDGVQDEDTLDMGFHYPCFTTSTMLSVSLTPENPPIVIPASGDSFDFNIEVSNDGPSPETADIWCDVTLPNGSIVGPTIGPVVGFLFPGNWSANRDRSQDVPGSAPPGTYSYNAYVGIYPNVIYDEDNFSFSKSADDASGDWITDWANTGESFNQSWHEVPAAQPEKFALHRVYPNPFNPATAIRFDLPVANFVKLEVFDIAGCIVGASASRRTAPLLDGWMDAGRHEVTFDGSALASGVYIYRITADDFIVSGKMVLIR